MSTRYLILVLGLKLLIPTKSGLLVIPESESSSKSLSLSESSSSLEVKVICELVESVNIRDNSLVHEVFHCPIF